MIKETQFNHLGADRGGNIYTARRYASVNFRPFSHSVLVVFYFLSE